MRKNKKQSVRILAIPVLAAGMFFSCGKSTPSKPTDDKKDTVQQQVTIPQQVELKCVNKGPDKNDAPVNEVVLVVDGEEQTIDTIQTSCNVILPAEYASYKIPADAKSACGGWWAGGGDYFYAVVQDNAVKVFQGWQDEGQEDEGYHWQEKKLTR